MLSKEAEAELRRRCNLILENVEPGSLAYGRSGSLLSFEQTLAAIGYPFKNPPEWMDEQYLERCVTDEEFYSVEYHTLLEELFDLAHAEPFERL